jgi:hypothetical protein
VTRKDYELVASTIQMLPADVRNPVALVFAQRLGDANANFDREKFLAACGVAG